MHVEKLTLDADPSLTNSVIDAVYRAKPERIFRLRLEALDWNCPQHITPRYTEQERRRESAWPNWKQRMLNCELG